MPLYAYECKECGVNFERRQGFDEEPIKICPECDGEVHRLIQPAGIVFKGSGFYSTDNKSSRSSTPATTNKKSDSPTSDSTTSDSGAKTEAKAEAAPKPAPVAAD